MGWEITKGLSFRWIPVKFAPISMIFLAVEDAIDVIKSGHKLQSIWTRRHWSRAIKEIVKERLRPLIDKYCKRFCQTFNRFSHLSAFIPALSEALLLLTHLLILIININNLNNLNNLLFKPFKAQYSHSIQLIIFFAKHFIIQYNGSRSTDHSRGRRYVNRAFVLHIFHFY